MALSQRQRILVMDDDPIVRDAVGEFLSDAGYQAVVSGSWDMGETNFESIGYSLVVTDIFMPGRSGLDVIRDVRRCWPEVKVLAISGGWNGMSAGVAVKAAREIGADAGLQKPFDFHTLVDQVRDLIGEPVAGTSG